MYHSAWGFSWGCCQVLVGVLSYEDSVEAWGSPASDLLRRLSRGAGCWWKAVVPLHRDLAAGPWKSSEHSAARGFMNQQSKRASQECWHHSQSHCGSGWWDCIDRLHWHCLGTEQRHHCQKQAPLEAAWRLTATAPPFHTSSRLHVLSIRNSSQTEQLSVSTVSAQFRQPLAEIDPDSF